MRPTGTRARIPQFMMACSSW